MPGKAFFYSFTILYYDVWNLNVVVCCRDARFCVSTIGGTQGIGVISCVLCEWRPTMHVLDHDRGRDRRYG